VRILAIDPGRVRLGLALSDPEGIIAQPLRTLRRRSPAEDMQALLGLVAQYEVELVLVGLPRLMDGTLDVAAREAQTFGAEIARTTGRQVEYWDERLTTVEAERLLLAQGKRRQQRRATVDQIAAALLLQSYLNYRRRQGGANG